MLSSYVLKPFDESYSIGISGLNTLTIGVSFLDKTLSLKCLKNPGNK